MFFIIAYDTPSNKRRRRIARIAEGYASRVQKSVFETHLGHDKVEEMINKMKEAIDPEEDNIRIYEIPKDYFPRIRVWGKVDTVEEINFYYVSTE